MNSRPRYSELYRGIGNLTDVSIQERCLLYRLANFADPDGSNIFPSQTTLAKSLKISESYLRQLIASLRKKKYLTSEQRKGYYMRYRINIPGVTLVILSDQPDISSENWESQFLTDEELRDQGLLVDEEKTDLEETQPRLQIVRPVAYQPPPPPPEAPAAAQYRPPGQRKLTSEEVLETAASLARKGIMSYEWYMRGGRRKGYTDEYLNWIYSGGGGEQEKTDSSSSANQAEDESAPVTFLNYQEQAYINHESMQV